MHIFINSMWITLPTNNPETTQIVHIIVDNYYYFLTIKRRNLPKFQCKNTKICVSIKHRNTIHMTKGIIKNAKAVYSSNIMLIISNFTIICDF